MNTPVSFELAKLLKEKGFLETCEKVYRSDGLLYTPTISGSKLMHSNILDDCSLSAPTIAEVVMWLYEKHGIWIEVSLIDNSRGYYFDYTIITSKDRDFNDEDCFDSAKRIYDEDKHNSPTEAYEAAIEYVLTKLI